MRARFAWLFVPLAALIACEGRDRRDVADSASIAATASAAPVDAVSHPDAPSAGFRLTRDRLDRYFAAEKGIHEALLRMSPAERRALSDAMGEEDVQGSVEDVARSYEAVPVMAGAIRSAGVSPSDFVATMRALDHARMAVSQLDSRPEMNADSIARSLGSHPDDIAFVREHRAEIERLLRDSNDRQVLLEKQMAEVNRTQPEPE